jgi:uncharacterized protein (DUF58 family)
MATPALIRGALPSEHELHAFARAAAHLLVERAPRSAGARTVARQVGVGIQHLDHRDYAPGDEVRHIDWRQTARSRRPILRRFESEAVSDWTLLLDVSSSMAVHGRAKWQAAVRISAAMGYALLQLGHRVGLLAFGTRVVAQCPAGRGQPHNAALARLLATLQPAAAGERSDLGACAQHLHGVASVFVVSDFLADGEMARDLTAVRQRCSALHAVQVSTAQETRLAADGELDLVDVETGARLPLHASGHASALATGERAAMTARLRAFSARSGVAFSDWDITQPWQPALLHHLLQARANC